MEFDEINIKSVGDIEKYFDKKGRTASRRMLSITIGYPVNELKIIDKYLFDNDDCILQVIIDMDDKKDDDKVWFLDVLEYLPHAKEVAIFVSGINELKSINEISNVSQLYLFELIGNYKKNISLQPIEKFTELKSLELNWGLDKIQQKVVNTFETLKKLSVRTINLSEFHTKKSMEDLTVKYSIKEYLKLADKFPNLRYLSLNQCKEIKDFSFINNISRLEDLSLNYMPQLIKFPELKDQKEIKKLMLLEARNLENIKNILMFEKLEKLAITRTKKLKAKDFEIFSTVKHLNTLYADFETNKEREEFEKLSLKNGWTNSILNW